MALIAMAGAAQAAAIAFSFAGLADGNVGGRAFTGARFSIHVVADTKAISDNVLEGFSEVPARASSLSLAGYPTASFTAGQRVFVNNRLSVAGLSRSNERFGSDLLDLGHADFANYDLRTELALANPTLQFVGQFHNEPSSVGDVTFTDARQLTFRADLIPEPAAALSLGTGLVLALRRRRPVAVSDRLRSRTVR
jgi:hypothetical protein